MSTLHLLLLLLYLAAAAGYGGWRGSELWSGWGVWCLLLPPLVWAAAKAFADWRRNRYWSSVRLGLAMIVVAVVTVGGPALFLAWLISESSERWSAVAAVRAMFGVGMVAAVGGLAMWGKTRGAKSESPVTSSFENVDGPAEPDATTGPR